MPVKPHEILCGAALDLAAGDPRWLPHPVRGIGWFATKAERFWRSTRLPLRLAGALFWFSIVGASTMAVRVTLPWANIYWIYALLAARDLDVQSSHVVHALERANLADARDKLSRIVGRDTAILDEPEILRATIETVAENLSDGVIAPLFYLALGGPACMAAYKAINTLDSMVGHRSERYLEFGWFSARADDIANFIPARLTAIVISAAALLPGFSARRAVQMTIRDGHGQPSPNAGFPESACAGALGVQLGGLNFYHGVPSHKPAMGDAIVPLTRGLFRQVRILLYVSEAICLAALLRFLAWK